MLLRIQSRHATRRAGPVYDGPAQTDGKRHQIGYHAAMDDLPLTAQTLRDARWRTGGFAVGIEREPRIRERDGMGRGQELVEVLRLAEQFPARHQPPVQFLSVLGR